MRLFTTNSCGLVGSSTFRRRSSSRKISICAARLQSRREADPTLTDNMIARGRSSVTLEPEPAAKRLAAVVVVAEPSVVPGTSAGDTRWRKNHPGKGAPGAQIKGEANPDHGHQRRCRRHPRERHRPWRCRSCMHPRDRYRCVGGRHRGAEPFLRRHGGLLRLRLGRSGRGRHADRHRAFGNGQQRHRGAEGEQG